MLYTDAVIIPKVVPTEDAFENEEEIYYDVDELLKDDDYDFDMLTNEHLCGKGVRVKRILNRRRKDAHPERVSSKNTMRWYRIYNRGLFEHLHLLAVLKAEEKGYDEEKEEDFDYDDFYDNFDFFEKASMYDE